MKKKWVMMGTGVALGSMLLMSSVYAGIGQTPGYDTYKSAIKNTAKVDNVTREITLSVEDNNQVLAQMNVAIKSDKEDHTSSGEVTFSSGGTQQGIQIFGQEDKKIIKVNDSDVYQIVDMNSAEQEQIKEHKDRMEQHDPAFAKEVENVIDTLVGNLKNNVTMKEDGAVKDIALHLTGSQIPAIVNAIGSIIIREGGRDHGEELELNPANTLGIDVQSIKDSLPKLAEDIRIESVNLDAQVNEDNVITNQAAEIRVTGKDSEGTNHQVVIKLDLILSKFNSTIPETVDLTDKQVEHVQPFPNDGFNRWHKH